MPGPVLLLGAPGVGKGTQAQVLMAEFDIPQISTGDILRAIKNDPVKAQTQQGFMAKGLMERGLLVPDELVNELVADRLAEPDTGRGYILDGFPRTLLQAAWLDAHLASLEAQDTKAKLAFLMSAARGEIHHVPVIAVSIKVGYDQLLERITGRRTCSACKHIYNVFSNPPKTAGLCDFDGTILEQRADDTEAVFAERIKTFDAQTAPVIDYYRRQGCFEEVDGNKPVKAVTADIKVALRRLRGQGAA